MLTVKVKLDPGAQLPTRAHATDVGYDITALRTALITGSGTSYPLTTEADCKDMQTRRVGIAKIRINTGVHLTPPPGYYIELVPNSRIAKTPFMAANSIGIIDPEYTGSIHVILNCINCVTPEDLHPFLPGRVVGQLILRRRHEADFVQVEELETSERGSGGFGSTERKEVK